MFFNCGRSCDARLKISSAVRVLLEDALNDLRHLVWHGVMDHVTGAGQDVKLAGRQLSGEGN